MNNAFEESIIILAEECAEVIQECSKVQRFGNTKENLAKLYREIGQLEYMIDSLHQLILKESGYELNDELQGIRLGGFIEKESKLKIYSTFLKN